MTVRHRLIRSPVWAGIGPLLVLALAGAPCGFVGQAATSAIGLKAAAGRVARAGKLLRL